MDYLDFDLYLAPAPTGYRVRATNAQGANASADFVLTFSALEIENLILRVARPRRGIRRIESPEMYAAKEFGGKLFDTVFTGEVFGMWRSSWNAARQEDKGLRLRLRLTDTPELLDLPWEFLYDKSLNRFVALITKTPLVRYLDLPTPLQPLKIQLPLRVLVMISDASDYEGLDVEREWKNLQVATKDLQARGLLALERLEQATPAALRRALRQSSPHILHFIGHGAFDANRQDGALIFQNEKGLGQRISSQTLGHLLANFDSLRLVVLNACEGARTSRSDPFAGVAPSLVQQDIPAVIAMQFEVSDGAALTFANEFYSALADGYAVDAALSQARSAILTDVNDLEWGTPVLYMRAPDGVIFDLASAAVPPPIRPAEPEPEPPPMRVITPEPQYITPAPQKIELPARRTNKAGQEMILIPAGEFLMGSADADSAAQDDEKPQHPVYLDAFHISRYPVTNAEYKKFVDATNHRAPEHWISGLLGLSTKIPDGKQNHPVVHVNWDDAAAFCKWVNGRLPTEAEWEKAASWDEGVEYNSNKRKRIYPWGDRFDADKCNSAESKIRDTTPVGKYSPQGDSAYGVGDMAGNVWEWCADWYDGKYYQSSPRENPHGPSSGMYRVVRVGAFDSETRDVRCACRHSDLPSDDYIDQGFRAALSPV